MLVGITLLAPAPTSADPHGGAASLATRSQPSNESPEPRDRTVTGTGASDLQAIEAAEAAVVRIETIGGIRPERGAGTGFRPSDGPTTGIVWDDAGRIVTSTFNLARAPSLILVKLTDDSQYAARLIARDETVRLALLEIDARPKPISRASRSRPRVGQAVTALGRGQATTRATLSRGIVSALNRTSGLNLQTDAKTSPANYGGPLLDRDGQLLGVIVPSDGKVQSNGNAGVEWYNSGIGFAVPTDLVAQRVGLMLERRADLQRGFLGVQFDPRPALVGTPWTDDRIEMPSGDEFVTISDGEGALVLGVVKGTPAEEAGLEPGDIVIQINDVKTPNVLAVQRALVRRVAGESLSLKIRRGEERIKLQAALTTLPAEGGDASQAR